MKPPSHIYKKQVAGLTGDAYYLAGRRRDIEKGNAVRAGMEGKFGVLLMQTIENIERELYLKVVEMPAWRIFEQTRARAELSAIQLLKARLLAYVDNRDALFEEMRREEEENA